MPAKRHPAWRATRVSLGTFLRASLSVDWRVIVLGAPLDRRSTSGTWPETELRQLARATTPAKGLCRSGRCIAASDSANRPDRAQWDRKTRCHLLTRQSRDLSLSGSEESRQFLCHLAWEYLWRVHAKI